MMNSSWCVRASCPGYQLWRRHHRLCAAVVQRHHQQRRFRGHADLGPGGHGGADPGVLHRAFLFKDLVKHIEENQLAAATLLAAFAIAIGILNAASMTY